MFTWSTPGSRFGGPSFERVSVGLDVLSLGESLAGGIAIGMVGDDGALTRLLTNNLDSS